MTKSLVYIYDINLKTGSDPRQAEGKIPPKNLLSRVKMYPLEMLRACCARPIGR